LLLVSFVQHLIATVKLRPQEGHFSANSFSTFFIPPKAAQGGKPQLYVHQNDFILGMRSQKAKPDFRNRYDCGQKKTGPAWGLF
jgi:hypothetical protein